MTHIVAHYGDYSCVAFSTDKNPNTLIADVPTHVYQLIRVWQDDNGEPQGFSPDNLFAHIGTLTTEEAETLLTLLKKTPTLNDLAQAALEAKENVPEGTTPEHHLPYVDATLAYWKAIVARAPNNSRAITQMLAFTENRKRLTGE